jgi:hypothetical protein
MSLLAMKCSKFKSFGFVAKIFLFRTKRQS